MNGRPKGMQYTTTLPPYDGASYTPPVGGARRARRASRAHGSKLGRGPSGISSFFFLFSATFLKDF
jgi:hypothetical protein